MSTPRCLLASAFLFGSVLTGQAQLQIKGGTFNRLNTGGAPVGSGASVTTPQFAGQGATSATAGPVLSASEIYDGFPSDKQEAGGVIDRSKAVLRRAGFGGVFASGVPRYALGEQIVSPPDDANLVESQRQSAAPGYWRPRPVLVGEGFTNPGSATPVVPLVTPQVTVQSSATTSKVVTVSGTHGVNPGATLLGQRVLLVEGNTVTLAGNAGQAISTPTPVDYFPRAAYYYSPHAERVFAHQPGQVTITWVTQAPVYDNGTTNDPSGDTDGLAAFQFRAEIFIVGSGTNTPVRTIYWTERSFNGPVVNIPTGRIVTVNPVYSDFFSEIVAKEYESVGSVAPDPSTSLPPERRTLWFDKTGGAGQLHAYNLEGRIFVEYLGALKPDGGTAVHEFLGADVVEVVQVATPTIVTVRLGEQIQPHDASGQVPVDADILLPSEVHNLTQIGPSFYGSTARSDGRLIYHAERENYNPDRVTFYWLEQQDVAIHFLEEPSAPQLDIAWPRFLNKYLHVWPDSLGDFVGITVGEFGSTIATGVQFIGGNIPEVVHQDDGAQSEVAIDLTTQRLIADLTSSGDRTNRTLLKFSNGSAVWYIRTFIQSADILGSPFHDPDGPGPLPATPAVATLADRNADGIRDLIDSSFTVGSRIERPGPQYELAGYIAEGTGYHPGAYQDPFVAGVEAAGAGAIIPVNAIPGENTFRIWWFERIASPVPEFGAFYVPSTSGDYAVSWPATSQPAGPDRDQIILASNSGSGDLAEVGVAEGEIYVQNDSSQPGYNPNEEHALMLGGRAYALRDDLNVTSGAGYTSGPFVLVSHTDPDDGRPAVRAFEVLREIDQNDDHIEDPGDILFNYPVTAGATVPSPMPLPLLPVPVRPDGTVPNREVVAVPDPAPDASAPPLYDGFTYQERKGYTKVYRGPHAGGSPTMGMQFYYTMQENFFVPGANPQPAAGVVLPYLRPLDGAGNPLGDPVDGTPQTIIYRPAWPDAVPELRIGETLTLPKFGLPQVRGQSSAEVLYQQSIATDGATMPSVTLHDPTRAKTVLLGPAGLDAIPASIATTTFQGRTYFQRLPPHLQQRFYATLGADPQLVFLGEFVNEIAGEDYLNLNVLSAGDVAALKGLVDAGDVKKSAWEAAIDALSSSVETFIENPALRGTYKVGTSVSVNGVSLAAISDSDTAVDSYALTATGDAAGYVSLLFGDGEAFTAEGDPVSIAVVKVVPKLYTGDMKVLFSSNPLDEQVTLRHSGDFAARPQDYEFEWRYASGGTIPPVYQFGAPVEVLGGSTTWRLVQNPSAALPGPAEYTAAAPSVAVPRAVTIQDADHGGGALPGIVMKSDTAVDFGAGLPGEIIFSADLSNNLDGFVLYVNGIAALGFRAPAPFENSDPTAGLSASGLPSQFRLSTNYFTKGANTIEVALFSAADPLFTSSVNFRLETITKQDRVDPTVYPSSPWLQPGGTLLNQITIGGSPSAPLGAPLLIMQDNAFTVRYRPKLTSGGLLTEGKATQEDVEWSDWMEPKLIPGWVKRVLDAINPYNQRMTDLYNNAVNTDVSILTQAGTRWEGDIALNLDNINEAGLIEIYETVLNRAKLFSIESGYDDPGVNNALLLAAGYLNDLYVILGNEAFADAANPTISLDDQNTVTEVSTSRFSFEGQVGSVLEEELALLRGRDDLLNTSVGIAPAYNRLYWNYTNGIEAGEVIYAVNYNIKEKVGSSTENGIIDAADAYRMFPQAHGDAYGHYLTALKGYYQLLTNDNFTWTPRSETVLVLGQNVEIDYFDERKFAGAAADLARTAEQVLALTHRQSYQDDRAGGWAHFRDTLTNTQTNVARRWGVDEWASRSTQGAYFHWVNGNAMLPDEDTDPGHTGIRKVDRSTVPELGLLAATADTFQTTIDNANAFLNPLGLSPDSIAFDISPADLKAGQSHFEQIYQRALGAVLNTKGSFDQAGRMTRLLRNQDNQIDEFNTAIEDEERGFEYKLIDLYGSPYSGDVGPGKTYAQGYDGPDLINWFVVDRPTNLVDTSKPLSMEVRVPLEVEKTFDWALFYRPAAEVLTRSRVIEISPSPFAQYSDQWFGAGGVPGQRQVTGRIQQALTDAQLAYLAVQEVNETLQDEYEEFDRKAILLKELLNYHTDVAALREDSRDRQIELTVARISFDGVAAGLKLLAETQDLVAISAAESLPKVVGLSNDPTSSLRGFSRAVSTTLGKVLKLGAGAASLAADISGQLKEQEAYQLLIELERLGFSLEQQQAIHEMTMELLQMVDRYREAVQLALRFQKAAEEARTLLAQGDRIQLEREIFRRRAAAVVQGYRTRDVAFRTFRNEALEQYRTLFDLAARYTYLAAKSYDYETGLLGSPQGQEIFNRIVASRALGDLTGGIPQATVSTLGDTGLAGTMAQLQADFAVAEGRLGINNPDQNGTLFSLRHELFRLLDDPGATADDDAWQQTLEQHIVSDLMADPDAATYCMNLRKPDGSPVPGIVIPFGSTIQHGYNWFGLPLAGGDHAYSPSNFATKIYSAGMVLEGYVGMDPYAVGTPNAGAPNAGSGDSLSATPYVYLIPAGTDHMLAPPLGDTNKLRTWTVADQALPLPYNLGANDFNSNQFFDANGTLTEQPWIRRKHQAFRPVNDPAFFYSLVPQEFTSSRLVGRSVWNSQWKIVIPAYSLLNNEQEGLNRFVRTVGDIKLFLRTYSNSGN